MVVDWIQIAPSSVGLPDLDESVANGLPVAVEHPPRDDDPLAQGLAWFVEAPLVLGSVGGIPPAVRKLGSETSRAQTGLVRSYALAIAAGVTVLAIVFVAVR